MKNFWSGRFTKSAGRKLQEYWNSISFDWALVEYDIQGSIAHSEMLQKCNIIGKEEGEKIISGLKELLAEYREGRLEYALEDEDVHMNIERLLHKKIGPLAGKLHTARSRNDQVALDMHLYLRRETLDIISLSASLAETLLDQARTHTDAVICGYTHLQRAQPVLFSHHLLAYVNMLLRDIERLQDSYKRLNKCPLGAGAIAGTTFPIDRRFVAERLKFDGIYTNSMDAVSDRDFSLEFLSDAAIMIMHLSRFCEEVVLWSSYEFGFLVLDDSYSTGSSMMPQKKNPDLAELVRGKSGRVFGNLISLLTVLKGLPLTYNKDMQEDKECVFDSVETIKGALLHIEGMAGSWRIQKDKMRAAASGNFTNATDFADYLSKKGMPFREAHEVTGKLVSHCISINKEINELSLSELKAYSGLIEEDVFEALKIDNIINRRLSEGGTSLKSVETQIPCLAENLNAISRWLQEKELSISGDNS